MSGRFNRNFTGRQVMAGIPLNPQTPKAMKTMMELLISLRRMDTATETASRNRQLIPGEKEAARRHLDLVREVIPSEVLAHYDELKTTAGDLLESPELLAMAVLLRTYRRLSPCKRKRLLRHFTVTSGIHSSAEQPSKQRPPRRAVRCGPPALRRGLAVAG